MTDEDFEELVLAGIRDIRPELREKIENVAIVIEEWPSADVLIAHGMSEGETLFGLYEGVPLPMRGIEEPLLPDKITIYKGPILKEYSVIEDIRACVANTVWHEVAHYFGYDEEWIAHEEERRGKLK